MEAFGIVLIAVCIAAAIAGIASLIGRGDAYSKIGSGPFSLDQSSRPPEPAPGSPAARAEMEAEVRQMVEAKSARREARGEEPLDVDAEVATLLVPAAPVVDQGLRDEVRDLVVAGNERRQRRGEEPLDVEAEVDRQLRELGA